MRVRLAATAEQDLDEIAEWIGADNPLRAVSFVRDIERRCRSLAEKPNRFPVAITLSRGAVRKLTHRGYLIFYAVGQSHVDVLRIVHGARDWASLFADPQ